MSVLSAHGIRKAFRRHQVLTGVDLDIGAGELVAVATGRGDPGELPDVGAGPPLVRGHEVVLRDEDQDLVVQRVEAGEEHLDRRLLTVASPGFAVVHEVGGEQLVDRVGVAAVDDLGVEAADDVLVGVGRHRRTLSSRAGAVPIRPVGSPHFLHRFPSRCPHAARRPPVEPRTLRTTTACLVALVLVLASAAVVPWPPRPPTRRRPGPGRSRAGSSPVRRAQGARRRRPPRRRPRRAAGHAGARRRRRPGRVRRTGGRHAARRRRARRRR